MSRRFGLIAAAVFALLTTTVPAQAMPSIKLPAFPPEVAIGAAPAAAVGELADRRTRFSKTSRNPNGTFTTTVSSAPLNYRDAHGKWQPIDSTLVITSQGGYNWRSNANRFGTLAKKDVSSPDFLRFDVDGKSFGISLDGAASASASTSGSSIVYRGAFRGVNLRYDLTRTGAKETLTLADATAPTHYRFYLTPPSKAPVSFRPDIDGSWVILMPPQHGPVLVLQPPSVREAATTSRAVIEPDSRPVGLTMSQAGDRYAIDLTLDPAWLRAPARHFPIEIDPTITVQPDTQETYFHGNVGTDAGQLGTGTYMHVGDSAGHYDWGATQFDISAIPAGSQITSASLGIYYDAHYIGGTTPDGNGTTHTLEAHRMTAPWTPSSTTSALAFDSTVLSSVTMTIDGNKPRVVESRPVGQLAEKANHRLDLLCQWQAVHAQDYEWNGVDD